MTDKDTAQAYPSSWSPRATRILQVAVIVMGVLIAVGFIVVVGTIFTRMGGEETPPPAAATTPEIARLFGADSEVIATETDNGRLAVVLRTAQGTRVVLVDMRSGEIISVVGGS